MAEAIAGIKNRYDKLKFDHVKYWTLDDCCTTGPTIKKQMDDDAILIMLDIFHFMERILKATYGIKHPAYFEFCQKLSMCIFVPFDCDKNEVSVCECVCLGRGKKEK